MKTPCSSVELVPVDYFNFQCIFVVECCSMLWEDSHICLDTR